MIEGGRGRRYDCRTRTCAVAIVRPTLRFNEEATVRQRAAGLAARMLIALAIAAIAGVGGASTPSATECTEGAEFIGNAAHARENGVSRDAFLLQMQSDFDTVRAFPSELRWFVHDEADELFLLGAARTVFDRPQAPELHRAQVFHACMSRLMV
jgi:hypothetical protein